MRPALQCLIKFIYWLADIPPFSAMRILLVLEELQGQLFCCVLETELLCPHLIWTLVVKQCRQYWKREDVVTLGAWEIISSQSSSSKMDSNKTIFLPLAMSSVTLVLDLTKGCWKPARTLSSCIQKSEKLYVFLFNVGHWLSAMRILPSSQDESVIWVGMAV